MRTWPDDPVPEPSIRLSLEITPRVRRDLKRLVNITPIVMGTEVEFMALVVGKPLCPAEASFRATCLLLCRDQEVSPGSVTCTGIRETVDAADPLLAPEYRVIGVLHHHPFSYGLFHSSVDDVLLYFNMIEQFAVENRIPLPAPRSPAPPPTGGPSEEPAGGSAPPDDAAREPESAGVGFSLVVDLHCELYAEAALLKSWPSSMERRAVDAVPVDLVDVQVDDDPKGLPPELIAPQVARALRRNLTLSWWVSTLPARRPRRGSLYTLPARGWADRGVPGLPIVGSRGNGSAGPPVTTAADFDRATLPLLPGRSPGPDRRGGHGGEGEDDG